MDTLTDIEVALRAHRLSVFGGFHPELGEEDVPEGTKTLLLLGPLEPGFWAHVSSAPEFLDDAPHPLDRWSRRVIGRLACDLRAKALFPFTGPPYRPFLGWATRSGRAWQSPVNLLVHDTAGLMVSFRGALALKTHINLPPPPLNTPCTSCAAPCLTACPIGALTDTGYDVPACQTYLQKPDGADCLEAGCQVRRACPISQRYGRRPEQSGFHMRSFMS